jgi:hypothetical protein
LRKREKNYDAAAESCGLERARARETTALQLSYEASERMFAGRATSPRGIACKLYFILDRHRPKIGGDMFPWPQLESAYEDLVDMANEQDAATYM